ncbi:phosphomannomutase/phosphoglucomutase [Candidatus Roizmanbacteria bacterium]|nr:phosphomannomutase/phosphoglucomutase [Candidatus Roizmanbacteria bacterium]
MKTNVPPGIFRGYDLRGIADTELTDENVRALASGYATYLLSRRIYDTVLGRDCRISSPRIHDVVVETLLNAGITVYDIGETISQMAYFAQYLFRSKGMMMITASHNPKEYNGMKLGTGFSQTMETDEVLAFRDLVQQGTFTTRTTKGKHVQQDIYKEYETDLFRRVDEIGKFKIVVDSCNGSTGPILPAILRRAGCEIIEQNTNPDGNFPLGTPDPTERDVQERLAKRVISEKADLGFSYDTDGDRVGIVDQSGSLIWNDTLVAIFAKDILEHMPGSTIVFNTLCSKQVRETIVASGGKPMIWKTGHSFIKAKVKETNAPFGGELSGHFFFMDNFYGHDDGAIASLRLLSYLTRKKQTLAQAVSELPHYISSPEIKLGLADAIKFQLIDNEISNDLRKLYPEAEYLTIDGIRMDTKETMAVIRASQNGPYITIKFEAKTQEEYDTLKKQIHAILKNYSQIKFDEGVNIHAFD